MNIMKIQTYTVKELRQMYKLSRSTWNKRLREAGIDLNNRRLLLPATVQLIVDKFGIPQS